ncbi:hypothetical protein INR49_010876 [Caranx melampygus]|nr:hypothetical protein INR49_010876 [Caranx melampygus]
MLPVKTFSSDSDLLHLFLFFLCEIITLSFVIALSPDVYLWVCSPKFIIVTSSLHISVYFVNN